jgi:O-antigen/teichoic acid export membrane protein
MLNIKSFIKQSSIYTISSFLSRGISLLLIPLYTRVLNPADYGAIDILTLSCTLINMIIALEIHQAIARFYNAWSETERKRNISTALYFTIAVYLLFIFFSFPFRANLAAYFLNDKSKTEIIWLALFMAFVSGLYYFTQSQLRWQLQTQKHAVTSVIFTLSSALITIVLVLVYRLGLSGVLWGLISGNLIGIALSIYFARGSYMWYFGADLLFKMLKFSSPLVLSSISVFFSLYVDRILIKDMLSLKELGLFGIGYRFASIVGLLLVGVNNAITPLIYTHHADPSTPFQMEKIFRIFSIGALVLFVGISVMSKELLMLFTTEAYWEAEKVIPFLIITTLLSSLYNFTPGLFLANQTRIIAGINIVVAAANFILNLLLIPVFGIIGSCIATLIGYIINFLIYYYYNQQLYPINFGWPKYLIALLVSICVIVLSNYFPATGVGQSIIYKGIVVSLFGAGCIYFLADSKVKQTLMSRIKNI